MGKTIQILIAFALTLGVGMTGALITHSSDPAWYASLLKPIVTPPSWVFAPMWTLLNVFLAIALVRIWEIQESEARQVWLCVFFTQLVLNFLWSMLFFGLHSLFFSWIDVLVLWFTVLLLFLGAYKMDRVSALVLAPYLAWTTFAAILNVWVWYIN